MELREEPEVAAGINELGRVGWRIEDVWDEMVEAHIHGLVSSRFIRFARGRGNSTDLRIGLTCNGNCCNCAEWFTHQNQPGHRSHDVGVHVMSYANTRMFVQVAVLGLSRTPKLVWCICAGFRKQLPTILATWLAASDWRENPLSGRNSTAPRRVATMRSSSSNPTLPAWWLI